jgi:hypothetical protein
MNPLPIILFFSFLLLSCGGYVFLLLKENKRLKDNLKELERKLIVKEGDRIILANKLHLKCIELFKLQGIIRKLERSLK